MTASADALPYVDEHAIVIPAPAPAVWSALLALAPHAFSGTNSARLARLLGCSDTEASGPRPIAAGSSFPGFHVTEARADRELVLEGRHRFASYALIVRLDAVAGDRTRVRAETRAVFPGPAGRAYRALVIGTRGHVVVVRRLLSALRRGAVRGPAPRTADRGLPRT